MFCLRFNGEPSIYILVFNSSAPKAEVIFCKFSSLLLTFVVIVVFFSVGVCVLFFTQP